MNKKQKKVKVVVRVRPVLSPKDKVCVAVDNDSVEIFNHRNVNENIKYDFSMVYDMKSTQQRIYQECVKSQLMYALEGQNLSIFAYGPTGAGKTHTMLGSPSDPGIIPRVINGIFQKIGEDNKSEQEWKHTVTFSYLEIYNEKVMDLLEPKNSDLPIREDGDKKIFIPGLAEKEIHDFNEFKVHFGPASNNRTTAATKLNDRSSRSHSILMLKIKKVQQCAPYQQLYGKIYLIDLAGSEDNRRTGNQGIRLKESGAINKSLFVLGEVVDAINMGLPRIPYRNSKLTRLLQDSIGGTCHSIMITNIAPEEKYYYDTYCTLNFASKSKKIVNNTCINQSTASRFDVLSRKTPALPEPGGASAAKKPRMSAVVPDEPPKVQDPAPFLSPLLRRQNRLEETVNKRLEELERNIMTQMKQFSNKQDVSGLDPAMISNLQHHLEVSRQQLKTLSHQTPPTTPVRPNNDVLSEKTNKLNQDKPPLVSRPLKRTRKEDEISCSPLFATSARLFKKGFRSTASGSNISEPENDTKSEDITKSKLNDPKSFNPELQKKLSSEFIEKLNNSTVKELQSLQTVGAKRAKLIFEWREAYGSFSNYDDLKNIPGFTDKYIQNLLKSNLVFVS